MGNGSDDGLSAVALVGMDGFAVTGHVHRDGELWLAVETTTDRAWCPDCGARAIGNGRRRVLVRDLPIAGTPTVLVWSKRPGAAVKPNALEGRGRRRRRTSHHRRR